MNLRKQKASLVYNYIDYIVKLYFRWMYIVFYSEIASFQQKQIAQKQVCRQEGRNRLGVVWY